MLYITSVEGIGGYEGGRRGTPIAHFPITPAKSRSITLLQQKVGQLPNALTDRINALSLKQLEGLAITLLNFEKIEDLSRWLEADA
jgi:Domain of unknown function (DUF4351)